MLSSLEVPIYLQFDIGYLNFLRKQFRVVLYQTPNVGMCIVYIAMSVESNTHSADFF